MFFSLNSPHFRLNFTFVKLLHKSLQLNRNHYETLKLARTCSQKDIKDSFIQLSKTYHPDVNKSKDAHRKFLEINEAYKVLSNPQAKELYDLGLIPHKKIYQSSDPYIHRTEDVSHSDPWKDPSFYQNRDKSHDKFYENRPYYGIKGVNRVSNMTVLMICLAVSALGVGLQVIAIRQSVTFNRDKLKEKSDRAELTLQEVRDRAEKNGNEMQIELLKKRFEDDRKKNS